MMLADPSKKYRRMYQRVDLPMKSTKRQSG